MKLPKNVSGSLIVCVAAAAFAAGALFVEADDPTSSAVAAPAPIDAAASGGYGGRGAGGAITTATIEISGFEIAAARVTPGATVTVINRDDTAHTVTARDGSFSSGNVRGGSSVTFVAPDAPGSYAVFCEIHPSMKSTLTVG